MLTANRLASISLRILEDNIVNPSDRSIAFAWVAMGGAEG